MKVTPVNRKFGKYAPGDVFDFPDKQAKVFIKLGKLREVEAAAEPSRAMAALAARPHYQTRDMQAATVAAPDPAPYGYKADGTPRLRPAYNVKKVED